MLDIHKFPCLNDNYGYLVHEPVSGETAAVLPMRARGSTKARWAAQHWQAPAFRSTVR